jgi:Xaa-Pro aminopeptidase
MKSDLDRLMAERNIDALLVLGPAVNNPVMNYLSNGVKVGEATALVKKRGEAPVLIVNGMERDEAAKSGLRVVEWTHYDTLKILNEEQGDRLRAAVRYYESVFADLDVHGAVALYGLQEQGRTMALAYAFNSRANGAHLVGEYADTIFDFAWTTKDAEEVERIRAVGAKTTAVIGNTSEFLQSHRAANGVLVKKDGAPLTISDVKREIRRWETELNLEDPDGAIFAIGRDAGVPHSHGEDADPIALGQTIIYDIFPREPGGGYFFDITRTWCAGFAPPEVERAYADVMHVFDTVMAEMKVNDLCRVYQRRACELFEARGHPTLGGDTRITQGYVHSLGHGVGLNIHERPHFSDFEGNTDRIDPGCVVTVEPGLYYPDDGGYGVRMEDCLWMNPATNQFETLGESPKELVLPVKSARARKATSARSKPKSAAKTKRPAARRSP